MIKKHEQKQIGISQLICDRCGEGIGENSSKEDIDKFRKIHDNCKKEKNNGLDFLKNEKEYKPNQSKK